MLFGEPTTPGNSTELVTSPPSTQPLVTMLWRTTAPSPKRTGGRSALCVWMIHVGSCRSSGGLPVRNAMFAS